MSKPYPLEVILTPNKPALAETGTQPLQVLVRLRPKQDPSQVRTPISLAIVIDRSSSMSGGKLHAALDCTRELIERLHDNDEVSIIAYSHEVELLLPLSSVQTVRGVMAVGWRVPNRSPHAPMPIVSVVSCSYRMVKPIMA